jgi:hypothetical protein
LSKLSYFAHCRRVDVREAASGTLLAGCLSGHSGVVFRHVPTLQEKFHLSLYGFLVEESFFDVNEALTTKMHSLLKAHGT